MKMVDVEWQFDRKRITFFFTAEKRVDFRKILGDFAHQYRARIDMQRIGARDETARIGGVGACGRELCCSTWMHKIPPVAKNAWKKQNLAYNPVRLNGQCGQLKCCLNYELEQYMTALKDFPSLKTRIITGYGAGQDR